MDAPEIDDPMDIVRQYRDILAARDRKRRGIRESHRAESRRAATWPAVAPRPPAGDEGPTLVDGRDEAEYLAWAEIAEGLRRGRRGA